MQSADISAEINRIKDSFKNASDDALYAMSPLIEQAAHEKIYLDRLNKEAVQSGLVVFHPDNAQLQKVLPVSQEIARHAACLTNIMDKLYRHLGTTSDEEEDDLNEFE